MRVEIKQVQNQHIIYVMHDKTDEVFFSISYCRKHNFQLSITNGPNPLFAYDATKDLITSILKSEFLSKFNPSKELKKAITDFFGTSSHQLKQIALADIALEKKEAAEAARVKAEHEESARQAKELLDQIEGARLETLRLEELEAAKVKAEKEAAVEAARAKAEKVAQILKVAAEKVAAAKVEKQREEAARIKAEKEAVEAATIKAEQFAETARLEALKKQMAEEAAAAEIAKQEHNQRRIEELKLREVAQAEELLHLKEAAIEANKLKLDAIQAKLQAHDHLSIAAATAKIHEVMEAKKPAAVKSLESKTFIVVDQGNKLVMQYSSEMSDTQFAKGRPDTIELVKVPGGYSIAEGSILNHTAISNIIVKYNLPNGEPLRVLPSDIKSYAAVAPGLDMFYLAFLCWNPMKVKIDSFDSKHFDMDGYHYEGAEAFEPGSGMLQFKATLDNDFVVEALGELGAAVHG